MPPTVAMLGAALAYLLIARSISIFAGVAESMVYLMYLNTQKIKANINVKKNFAADGEDAGSGELERLPVRTLITTAEDTYSLANKRPCSKVSK